MRNAPQPLSIWESLDMWSRFAFRLAAPPLLLWCCLHIVRAVFDVQLGGKFVVPAASTQTFLIANTILMLVYWILQNLHFPAADGTTILAKFRRECGDDSQTSASLPGAIVVAVTLLVCAFVLSLLCLAGTSRVEIHYLILVVTGFATYPIVHSLFTSNTLIDCHRRNYFLRRDERHKAKHEALEAERQRALVIPPKTAETFESQLKRLTDEHHQRVSQLKLLPIEEEERAYLIELEVARFREAIRSLTDPSFSTESHALEN